MIRLFSFPDKFTCCRLQRSWREEPFKCCLDISTWLSHYIGHRDSNQSFWVIVSLRYIVKIYGIRYYFGKFSAIWSRMKTFWGFVETTHLVHSYIFIFATMTNLFNRQVKFSNKGIIWGRLWWVPPKNFGFWNPKGFWKCLRARVTKFGIFFI